jgi:hypothetical protein
MPYLHDENTQPVEGFLGRTLSEGTSDTWVAFLQAFNQGPDDPTADVPSFETGTPLQKLDAGPWRSIGGRLDYSGWSARERFLELDKAIACDRYPRGREGMPDPRNASASPEPVLIAEFTACRSSNPAPPVAFPRDAPMGLPVEASEEILKFVVAGETDYFAVAQEMLERCTQPAG